MALHHRNVEKAMHIIAEMMGWEAPFFDEANEDDPTRTGSILVSGRTGDGWESVFINVRDITDEQLEFFEKRRYEIHNTSWVENPEEGITRLGWF